MQLDYVGSLNALKKFICRQFYDTSDELATSGPTTIFEQWAKMGQSSMWPGWLQWAR